MTLSGYNASLLRREKYIAMTERHYPPTRSLIMDTFKGARILDFGCGPAGTLGFLGSDGSTVVDGLDYDALNDHAKYHEWEDVDGKYDCVLFSHVLEHMPYQESIGHVKRGLEIAQYAVIVVPNGYYNPFIQQRAMDPGHVCEPYSHPEYCAALEAAGVKVERIIRSDIYNKEPPRVWLFRLLFAWMTATSPFYDHVIVCRRSILGAMRNIEME